MEKIDRMEQKYSQPEKMLTADAAAHLAFLRPGESVLLCCTDEREKTVGRLLEQTVLSRGAVPIWLEGERTWKSILRQAFSTRAVVIVGEPLVILGLVKLAKFNRTPLFIRHAVTTGDLCRSWMEEPIVKGLDCRVWDYSDLLGGHMESSAGDPVIEQLRAELYGWSSILDCCVYRGSYGLELELVVFPGEKLPALPSCARRVVRPWNPEKDIPFVMDENRKNPVFSFDSH